MKTIITQIEPKNMYHMLWIDILLWIVSLPSIVNMGKAKHFANRICVTIVLLLVLIPFGTSNKVYAQENKVAEFEASLTTEVGSLALTSESKDLTANSEVKFTIDKSYSGGFTSISQFGRNAINKGLGLFGQDTKHGVKVEIYDGNGELVDEQTLAYEEAPEEVSVNSENFVPGEYTLKITDLSTGNSIEQDFTWGVLAINPNKPVYKPGETAKLAIAVLNEDGDMVCDAKVKLKVQSDNLKVEELTTENGSIKVNEEACRTKAYTLTPDYETELEIGESGTYQMTLTAITDNGTYTIIDSFTAEESTDFEIERITTTRVYPPVDYPVVIKVKANNDYKGKVVDKVPFSFRFYYTDTSELKDKFGLDIELDENAKALPGPIEGNYKYPTWEVDWKKGETYSLAYRFDAPDVSPEFYLLGPFTIGDYKESRTWQLANDATLTALQGAANWEADDTSYVDFTNPQTGGSPQTLSRALDDTDADFETMLTLSWKVTYFLSATGGDDTYQLLIRIVNGATILAAADSGGTFQEVAADVNSSTDVTTGPTAFSYVNTTANKTTWDGASIELQQVHTKSGGWDNHYIRTDFTEMTGTYTVGADSWTGIAYTNEGTTANTSGTICGRVNNTTEACDATDGSGVFVINTVDAGAGDQLTFFYDAGTGRGNTVTISDGGDIASGDNLKVYENVVMVRHEQGSDISIVDMDAYDSDQNDTDLLYDAESTPTLILESGVKFHVYSDGTNNHTFNPDGTVTTSGSNADFIVNGSGTAYFDTTTTTIAGDLIASGSATLNIDANTAVTGGDIITTGTSASITTSAGTPTVTLTSNGGSIGGGTTPTLTFASLTTTGSGTTTLTNSATINDNLTIGSGTTLTYSGTPTLTMTGGSGNIAGPGAITLYNLTSDTGASISIDGNLTVANDITNTGAITYSGTPTLTMTGGSGNLGGGAGAITLYNFTSDTGASISIDSSISVANDVTNTGSISYSGTPSVTFTGGSSSLGGGVGAISLYNLTSNTGATLSIDYNTSITGNLANTTTGIITYSGTPTVTMTGNAGNTIGGGSGAITFYNLTINPSSAATITINSDSTVYNTLEVAAADTLSIASGKILTHEGAATPTLTLPDTATISGSGTLYYTSSNSFPATGSFSAGLRIDGTGGSRNITDRTGGYGGNVELYSNSGTSKTFTLGNGAVQQIDITGNLTLNANGAGTVELDGNTHDPTVNITGNLDSTNGGGTENITTGSGAWTVTGNVDLTDVGTFDATGGTFAMNGASKTITSASESFNNFNATGGSISTTDSMIVGGNFIASGGTSFTHGTGNMTITGNFDVQGSSSYAHNAGTMDVDGTFDITSGGFTHGAGENIDILIAGDFTIASGTTWTENTTNKATSRVIFNGDLDYSDQAAQSIGNVVIGQSPETTNLTSDFVSNSLTVNSGDYFNTCEYELDIANSDITINGTFDNTESGNAGSVDPCISGSDTDPTTINLASTFLISATGTFVQDVSTLIMDNPSGTDTITLDGESLYNLTVSPAGITQFSDTIDIDNNLSITTGTLDMNGQTVTIGGSYDNDAVMNHNSSTVTFNATSGTKTIDANGTGNEAFYDLIFNDNSGTATWQLTDTLDVDNNLTINDGTLDVNGSFQINVGNNWDNSTPGGTFTASSGTVLMDAQDAGNTLTGTMTGSSSFFNIEFDDSVSSGAWTFGSDAATITNNFIITGGTVTAPSTTLTIAEDFTNGDGFAHNLGTVTFNTTATSILSYSSNTTFYNLSFSTGGKAVQFDDTYQTIIPSGGDLTIQGSGCGASLITLDSETNDDKWEINVNIAATYDVDYVDLEDSDATPGEDLIADNSVEPDNNNTAWTVNGGACGAVETRIKGDVRGFDGVRIQ